MKTLNQNKKDSKLMYSVPVLLVMLLVAALLVRSAIGVMGKERESARYVDDLEVKVSNLSKREGDLNDGIEKLKTDDGVIEEIREKFSVTQDGEHMAVFVESAGTSTQNEDSSLPWYKRFWRAIMGDK